MAGVSLFQVGEDVEFWRVLVHLSILALCLVTLEKALHHLEHKFPPSEKFQHMIKKCYRELLVLGLISLGLKIIKEMVEVDSYSKTMIAFQVADLTIFFLALALIIQSTGIFLLLRNQNGRADRAELVTTQDLANSVNSPDGHAQHEATFSQKLFCCGRAAKSKAIEKELVELRLLRRFFLRRFGLPQLFPFSKYLYRAQANQISHMIEVEPAMWLLLLVVAWAICGLLEVFKMIDEDMSESHELVESFVLFAWILMVLHVAVMLFFRSCVHKFLRASGFSEDKNILASNLNAIADEEATAWKNEDADSALEIMSRIQEHHEEMSFCRAQDRHKSEAGVQVVVEDADHIAKMEATSGPNGVQPGAPIIQIRFFNHKMWHIVVMFLLILNGFFITLFAQCAVYDLDDIYEDFGPLATVLVPLPLLLSALVFQPRIFYDFVIISNILHIDSHTLSDVVENFSEVVRLRSEFATTLVQHLMQQELGVVDLLEELKTRDPTNSGLIEVDDLRSVLAKFGFRLTRFRFNSVVKLLFELESTQVAYVQVVNLVTMAQNEHIAESVSVSCYQQPHPLLRPSVLVPETAGLPSMQSSYSLFNSTRQFPVLGQPSMEAEPHPDDFVNSAAGSHVVPVLSHRSMHQGVQHHAGPRPSVSSQALHDIFNLRGVSETYGATGIVKL